MADEYAFSEILSDVTEDTGHQEGDVQDILESFFQKLAEAIANNRRVDLSGKKFGVFRLEAREAESGVIPSPDGGGGFDMVEWSRPERDEVVFRPSPGFTTEIAIITGKPTI